MGTVVTPENDKYTYILLPKDYALLHIKFNNKDSFTFDYDDLDVKIKKIASEYTRKIFSYSGNKGSQILFSISTQFYRGKINPDETTEHPKGLEGFLGNGLDINSSDEEITKVAQEIKNQLPSEQRENPYALTNGILCWMKENIEPVPVPKKLIEQVADKVSWLSEEERTDAYKILRYSFNIRDDILRRVSDSVYLSSKANDYEIAKDLMTQVDRVWGFFQLLWLRKQSAKDTLKNKSGKCVGISNLFVALSRNLGVPSRRINGYYYLCSWVGERHAWAASYIHPLGWVEIDPTLKQFQDFDYNSHVYRLFSNKQTSLEFTMIEEGRDISDTFEEVKQLLEEDKTLFGRKKYHSKELEFLQNLKK